MSSSSIPLQQFHIAFLGNLPSGSGIVRVVANNEQTQLTPRSGGPSAPATPTSHHCHLPLRCDAGFDPDPRALHGDHKKSKMNFLRQNGVTTGFSFLGIRVSGFGRQKQRRLFNYVQQQPRSTITNARNQKRYKKGMLKFTKSWIHIFISRLLII